MYILIITTAIWCKNECIKTINVFIITIISIIITIIVTLGSYIPDEVLKLPHCKKESMQWVLHVIRVVGRQTNVVQ